MSAQPTHTPAPWHIDQPRKKIRVRSIEGCFVADGVVFMADAHLIAAAPELLAALKLIVDHFGDPLKVARAAINKAEGRS